MNRVTQTHMNRFPARAKQVVAVSILALVGILSACSESVGVTATVPLPTPPQASVTVAALTSPTPEPTASSTETPEATATSTPSPTRTATPTPSPTIHPAASKPAISAIPQPAIFPVSVAPLPVAPSVPQGPFPSPTPTPQPSSNLAAHVGDGGVGLALTGASPSGEYNAEDIVVSWWVRNGGPFTTNKTFKVELRFDDVPLASWTVDGLSTSAFIYLTDIDGLFDDIKGIGGVHEIALVIDSHNTVNETVEHDNRISKLITISSPSAQPVVSPELLPNLVPYPDTGKTEPVFASSHAGDPLSGKLSVDTPTHVSFSASNQSIQYITEQVDVHLYLDDKLVRRTSWNGLSATGVAPTRIADLQSLIDVSPGTHTLKVVVDPLNRVLESDETDNVYEVELVWGNGEPAAAEIPFKFSLPAREPTLAANLMPYRKYGWDSALTVRPAGGSVPQGKNGWIDASGAVAIDFSFINASRHSLPLTDQLEAAVLVDGVEVERSGFRSGSSNVGSVWLDTVVLPAGQYEPDEHDIRIVLDPDNLFEEITEDDNIFERTVTFHTGPDTSPDEPFMMTNEELAAAFAPLSGDMGRQVKPVLGPGAGERDWTPEIMAAARGAYYLLTGRDLDEEGYAIHLLPHDEFKAGSISTCMASWVTMSIAEYEEKFESCTVDRNEIGFKVRANGQIHLFVDLGLSPMDALGTYFHELGHGLQDLTNPHQTELPYLRNTRGLFEAQAQIFEAAAWRAIEEYTGEALTLFPDIPAATSRFEFMFSSRVSDDTEHDIGFRLLWSQALASSMLVEQLDTNGRLDAMGAKMLYDYLVDINPSQVENWAAAMLARTGFIDEYREIAETRFVADLPLELVPHPATQDAAWIAP